ncbi:16S rRNA (guanine(527)-N(7))-methyltransferase RsmG [Aurantiacibacter spongiae]|uniref:Ribosomal RNA small subunit methyltransferase G n=1 Tax=Aurantiacibacter spongiae TaxID=2488860 RepID=A0A3N5D9S2_9SPHN|nr:16S rRNA (guanine(527)-N(7))-methyltransferase RsmG [Aurantiacibacter spongiae]RPF71388.1 16S rRNA (guanine(527)-N(7))-methyltransferase RsmG [Aurantiacibacter spongiae]
MIRDEDEARDFCRERCDPGGMERLETFVRRLARESSKQNLVSKPSLDEVWTRHIADSLQLLDHVPRETGLWLDLGSGAGLPGLVIAAAQPSLELFLVEARRKRVEWLRSMARDLGLACCTVIAGRVETMEPVPVQIISARAFAPLGKLLSLGERFSTHSTVWVLPKGQSGAQELSEQSPAVRSMFHVEQSVTSDTAKILVGEGRPILK